MTDERAKSSQASRKDKKSKSGGGFRFKSTKRDRSASPRRERRREERVRERSVERERRDKETKEDVKEEKKDDTERKEKKQKKEKKEKKVKEKKPASSEPAIVVRVNDRLGTTAEIPCYASDTIRDFKIFVARQVGRAPHEILLKRQGERPFKDALTLEDYGVSNGVQLDLEVDTGGD